MLWSVITYHVHFYVAMDVISSIIVIFIWFILVVYIISMIPYDCCISCINFGILYYIWDHKSLKKCDSTDIRTVNVVWLVIKFFMLYLLYGFCYFYEITLLFHCLLTHTHTDKYYIYKHYLHSKELDIMMISHSSHNFNLSVSHWKYLIITGDMILKMG